MACCHSPQSKFATIHSTGWMSEDSWFDFQQRQEIFLSPKVSELGMGPTQPRIQFVVWVNWPGLNLTH
jgi:hypothetical protein